MVGLVVGAGFLCGIINTLAGSGSLVTLPLLIFIGLPANMANGTNRVAIFLQNIIGVASFHREKVLDWKRSLKVVIPALIGSLIGAIIAVDINEEVMSIIIGIILVVMLFFILLKPSKWLKPDEMLLKKKVGLKEWIIFFAIGVYGGFIQAGVGFFLLAGLVLGMGYDLVKANASKLLIVLCYTPIALLVFAFNGLIHIKIGLIMACGNMIGAYLASKMAVSWGPKFIRWLLIAIIIISAAKLFGIFEGVSTLLE